VTNVDLTAQTITGETEAVLRGPRPPQQDRGQKRVESILDAAGELIAEVGMEAATMQAIADRAGASMGSLYHFFPNKDALVEALARRIVSVVTALNAQTMPISMVHAPLSTLFDQIVEGHFEFCQQHPSFMAVLEVTATAQWGQAVHAELHTAIVGQVTSYLEARLPGMDPMQRGIAARIAVAAVDNIIGVIAHSTPEEQGPMKSELKQMLVRYFEPYERDYGISVRRPA
jgi:AcrR family transcriptional regulator